MSSTVKKGIENFLYFSNTAITFLGQFFVDGAASGTFDTTSNRAEALPTDGRMLLSIANQASESDVTTTLEATGTDTSDVALVKSAVNSIRAARTKAALFGSVVADEFKTLTGITNTAGGVDGDLYDIIAIEEYFRILSGASVWVYIPFTDGLEIDLGPGFEAVFDKFEVDHNKRTRLENTLTLTARYVDVETSLMLMDGASVSLRNEIRVDGRATVSEQWHVGKARLQASPSIPEGEGIVTITAEGVFSFVAREILVSDV